MLDKCFSLRVKFTLTKIKWNERYLVLWQVCIFLGNSDGMIYFQVEPQFPLKMKKLESWWLIATFSIWEGLSGFWRMLQGQATKIPTPTTPSQHPTKPRQPFSITKNCDQSPAFKFSYFFFGGGGNCGLTQK